MNVAVGGGGLQQGRGMRISFKEPSGIWVSLNTGLCRTYTLLQPHVEEFFEGGDLVMGLAKSIERFQSGEAGGNLKMTYMTRSGDRQPILGQI